MEHSGDNERKLAETMTFNDWMDLVFEDWFEKFCREQNLTREQFRAQYPQTAQDIKSAFRIGWISCENFYS